MRNVVLSIAASFAFGACNTVPRRDITQVPHIEPSHVTIPSLMFLRSRKLSLSVNDQRSAPLKQNSAAVVNEVRSSVTSILEASGIDVSNHATDSLSVSFQEDPKEQKSHYCVQLSAHLLRQNNSFIDAASASCFEKNGPLNMKKGGDISRAYEQALRLLFEKLDEVGHAENSKSR